jgi:chromosome segregation ATPase
MIVEGTKEKISDIEKEKLQLQTERERLAHQKRIFEKEKTKFEENSKILHSDKNEIQNERQNLMKLSDELQLQLQSLHLRISHLSASVKESQREQMAEDDEDLHGEDGENCVVM